MPVKIKDPCCCSNEEFRLYHSSDNARIIGKCCKKCGVEYLMKDYLSMTSSNDVPDSPLGNTLVFMKNDPIKPNVNTAFQIQSARSKIEPQHFAETLKPGDHVAWNRCKGYWHHSIVSAVDAEKNEIAVIHWNKDKDHHITIFEERQSVKDSKSLFNQMYRIEYPDKITKANPPELILARARSRIGDSGYGFFSDNCEAFATYCKSGYAKSHQVSWLVKKIMEGLSLMGSRTSVKNGVRFISKAVAKAPLVAAEVIPAEIIEEAVNGSQAIGAGIVLIVEAGFIIFDVYKMYKERKYGDISRSDFIEGAVRRIIEGILSAGVSIGCSIGLEIGAGCLFGLCFGPIGALVGGLLGGIIGGIIGGSLIRVSIGTLAGSWAGKAIACRFPNDRVVKINELTLGDHIVLTGWFLHPRCHAIVLEHNKKDEILVIRNTHKKGVVQEWMKVEEPVMKVEYKHGACLEPEKVIENARSLLGQTKYNLATYNCKTFARECKTIPNLQKVYEGTDYMA